MTNQSNSTPMSETTFKIIRFINKCIVSIMIFVIGFFMLFVEVAIILSFESWSLIYNFGRDPFLEYADEEFIKILRENGKLPTGFSEDNEVIRILRDYGKLPPRNKNNGKLIPPHLEKIYNEMGIKIPKI